MVNRTGLYGKLPSHGDFIHRDLPLQFLSVWDEWLRAYVASTQEQLGEGWLDIYLTSPIWRFAFSEGVIDENVWIGIVLPSVDRVGRHFPFSIASRMPATTNPTEFICTRLNWYQALEDLALKALDGTIQIDELIEELNDSNPRANDYYERGARIQSPDQMLVKTVGSGPSSATVLPQMLDASLSCALNTYSLWSTRGSERVQACLFVCKSLPQLGRAAAMMDGRWQDWSWQEPFNLRV